jgi:putative SOS response-associated peptidase YedK
MLMAEIHNTKKRMPVILSEHYQMDWLNPALMKDDVLALYRSLPEAAMEAHIISKRVTDRKKSSNVPTVLTKAESGRLF